MWRNNKIETVPLIVNKDQITVAGSTTQVLTVVLCAVCSILPGA